MDPYFSGEAFDLYLSAAKSKLSMRIIADKYSKDVKGYVDKHKSQFNTTIELRKSK